MTNKIARQKIKDIASELEVGMTVYLNKHIFEYFAIPEFDELAEEDFWEVERRKIEEDRKAFIFIEKMDSSEAFKIMEQFTKEVVVDFELKSRLYKALANRKPFANFKTIVDDSNYRQQWFEFRTTCTERYVIDILKHAGIGCE